MASDSTDVGERMRQAREAKGLSQTELGSLFGVKQQSVAKIEAGGNTSPQNWLVIADALDTTVDALFGRRSAPEGGVVVPLRPVKPKPAPRPAAEPAKKAAKGRPPKPRLE